MRRLFAILTLPMLLMADLSPAQCVDYGTTDVTSLDLPTVRFNNGEGRALNVEAGTLWFLRDIYGGIAAVDMTNPDSPSLTEPDYICFESFSFDVAGDLACVSGLLLDDITLGIQLFDVSDPTAHIELGSLELGLYYTSGLAMTETHGADFRPGRQHRHRR